MTIEWVTLIGLVGTICGVVFGFVNLNKTIKKDTHAAGKQDGVLHTDIGYIKAGIDDIKRKQEKTDEQYIGVLTRLTAVEASAKQAHNRVDEITGGRK